MRYIINQRIFSWTDSYDITDEDGNFAYSVSADLFAFSHVLRLKDDQDNEIGVVKEKLFHFLPVFEVEIDNEVVATIRKEFTFFRPSYTLDSKDWQIEGDWLGWDYQVLYQGTLCATISKEFAFHDCYVIDILNPNDELMVIMLVLAIDAANCSNNK